MKIFSEMLQSEDPYERSIPVFAIYIDTYRTGNKEQDCFHSAADFSSMIGCNDPTKILEFLIPLLSELIYTAYGESAKDKNKTPLTEYSTTGFDPKCINGVKGFKLK